MPLKDSSTLTFDFSLEHCLEGFLTIHGEQALSLVEFPAIKKVLVLTCPHCNHHSHYRCGYQGELELVFFAPSLEIFKPFSD
jgi:hypothetical protein